MGIFDVDDALEKRVRLIMIIALIPVGLFNFMMWSFLALFGGWTLFGVFRFICFPFMAMNGMLYVCVYLTTSFHSIARVREIRAEILDSANGFFKQGLAAQANAVNQLNIDLRAVTDGPIFGVALLPWVAAFCALAVNNLAKLVADSKQSGAFNLAGFFFAMGITTASLLVPARVITPPLYPKP